MHYTGFLSLLLLAGPATVLASPVAFGVPVADKILPKTKDLIQTVNDVKNLVPIPREEEKRQGSSGFSGLFDTLGDEVKQEIAAKGGLAAIFNSSSSAMSKIPGMNKLESGSSSDDDDKDKDKNKNKNDKDGKASY